MNISHIEHLGIAVKNLEEAIPYYENVLGLKCYNIEEVADQKVRTAFFKVGDTKIELLEPRAKRVPSPSSSRTAARVFTTLLLPSRASKTRWPKSKKRVYASSIRPRVAVQKGLPSLSCIRNRRRAS